jgi:hypothetical protein
MAARAEERQAKPWYTCPACQVEWNRLRVCNYLDDNKQPATAEVCVKCAETLVAWDWLMSTMPLPSAFFTYMKWTGPRYRQMGPREEDEMDMPQNAYVIAEVAGMEIAARSEGSGRGIRYKIKGQEEVHNAENVFQLRSKLLHTIPY